MTHDENRISDLIDGGLHEKSAIDRAKYELHIRQKAAIEEAAIRAWEADAFHNPNPNNPHAYVHGFKQGAKEVIEHPERYDLYTKEYLIKHVNEVANEAAKVGREIERKYQNNRKPLGIQEARELVNQMLAEEISFSRFVELINEGSTK